MHVSESPVINSSPPDAALLTAWVERGDEAAFTALVERHAGLVQGVALRRLREEDAAREVTQTVFAILARKASRLREVRVLAAWLHRVAAAQSARAIRQFIRDRRLRDSVMHEASLTAGGRDPLADTLPVLDEALNSLPERDRELLMLRYAEGVSFAGAAARTGRSEAALRQQAGRAVDRLAAVLRRKGVPVPAAALSTGLTAVFASRDAGGLHAAVARAAVVTAPAVPAMTLFLTSIVTMSTLKLSMIGGAAALLLTGIPAVWQEFELSRLRGVPAAPVAGVSGQKTVTEGGAVPVASSPFKKTPVRSAGSAPAKPAAPLNMEQIGAALQGTLGQLMGEAVERRAAIEARRTALALKLSPEVEATLREKIAEIEEDEFTREEAEGNFQQRNRRRVGAYLETVLTPAQMEQWKDLQRQRDETEIEKIASDAFLSTARLVDLAPAQKDALFKKCAEDARALYATDWSNSLSAGVNISPVPVPALESDDAFLEGVLSAEQFRDWKTHATAQREFQEALPRRTLSNVFSVVDGSDLAGAIKEDMGEAASATEVPPPSKYEEVIETP